MGFTVDKGRPNRTRDVPLLTNNLASITYDTILSATAKSPQHFFISSPFLRTRINILKYYKLWREDINRYFLIRKQQFLVEKEEPDGYSRGSQKQQRDKKSPISHCTTV